MNINVDIVLGLTAAVLWGISDYMARFASRHIGAFRAQFYSQVAGLVVISGYLVLSGELNRRLTQHDPGLWGWTFLVALMVALASLAFFESFRVGVLALVAPIVGSFAAVTTVLSFLSGERFDTVTSVGLGISLLGVALASVPPGQSRIATRGLPPGVLWAIVAALTYGTAFWILGRFVATDMGGVIPVWLSRVLGPLVLLTITWRTKQSLSVSDNGWQLAAAVGILATLASVAAAIGTTVGPVAVITVLGSLSSAVTVVLALTLLKEKLTVHQWIGVIAALVGIVLLSL